MSDRILKHPGDAEIQEDNVENVSPNMQPVVLVKIVKTAEKKSPKHKASKVKPKSSLKLRDLILNAIKSLDETKGTSLAAIKKSIKDQNPEFDLQRNRKFILKILKKAIDDGVLKTKGPGLSGRFKIVSQKERKKLENAGKTKATPTVSGPAKKKLVKEAGEEEAAPKTPKKQKKGKRPKPMNQDVVSKKKKKSSAQQKDGSGRSSKKKSQAAKAGKKQHNNKKSSTVVQTPKSKSKTAKTKVGANK